MRSTSTRRRHGNDWPPMYHLSIKRNDKKPFRDWRSLQEIKNLLIGPEHEGVELFPAESRLVDSANQYHLYVFKSPGMKLPFGWTTRFVDDEFDPRFPGSHQRPFKAA